MPVLIVTSVHRIWMQPCNWYSFLITAATSCLSAAIPISPSPTPRACCRLPLSHTDFACYCYPTEVCFTKRVEADKSTGLAQALWLPLRPPASLLPPPTTSLLSPLTAGWQWFLSFSHRLCCSNPCVEGNNSPDRRSIPLGENLPSLTVFRCLRCQRCSSFRRWAPRHLLASALSKPQPSLNAIEQFIKHSVFLYWRYLRERKIKALRLWIFPILWRTFLILVPLLLLHSKTSLRTKKIQANQWLVLLGKSERDIILLDQSVHRCVCWVSSDQGKLKKGVVSDWTQVMAIVENGHIWLKL